MNRRKLIVLGRVAFLVATIFTEPTARNVLKDGLIGLAEATQRVCEDPCSIFNHPHIPLWQRLDPTCPQCL
jgi:hypothetical protein